MDLSKINPWIPGLVLAFAGSLLIYFESYRNSEVIDVISYLLILFGWTTVFIEVTKNTSVHAKKIFFKDDGAGWFKQRASNFIYYTVLIGVVFGNIYYTNDIAHDRKHEILANGPTKTAIAEVAYIDVRKSRHSTSYYAVFEFTVDGKLISHPWYEDSEADFLVGDKYMIKYSVEYPEMFMITEKVP